MLIHEDTAIVLNNSKPKVVTLINLVSPLLLGSLMYRSRFSFFKYSSKVYEYTIPSLPFFVCFYDEL